MKRFKRKSGVTLIELIIALGLLGVVTALIFFFFSINQKTLANVSVKSDLQYEAKVVIDKLSKYAMEATSAKVDRYTGDIYFDLVTDSGDKIYEGAVFVKEDKTLKLLLKNETATPDEIHLSDYVDRLEATVKQEDGSIAIDLVLENKGITYSVKESYLFRNKHLN